MQSPIELENLDDSTIFRITSHLTAQLREEMPDEATGIRDAAEARAVLESFLASNGSPFPASTLFPSDAASVALQARRLLALMLEDETTGPQAMELLANPPADTQKSVEALAATAVVLGGLVTWLQTRVDIHVERKNGQTDFRIQVKKGATSADIISNILKLLQ
jgi:hypothetical protein